MPVRAPVAAAKVVTPDSPAKRKRPEIAALVPQHRRGYDVPMRLVPLVALAAVVATPVLGHAATNPVQKCIAVKTKAAGKRAACLASFAAKAALGKVVDDAKCDVAFRTTRDKADAAAAKKGAACRLVDNGDGTVSDLDTLLMWEKKTAGNVGTTVTWPAAASDAVSAATGTSANGEQITGGLGGHRDWRLPNITELETIVDFNPAACGKGGTCIAAVFGPTHVGNYWTITNDQNDAAKAWVIGFDDGALDVIAKSGAAATRVVRGGK